MNNNTTNYSVNEIKQEVIDTSLIVGSIIGSIAFITSTISKIVSANLQISIFIETIVILTVLLFTYNRTKLTNNIKALLIISVILSFES